MRFKALLLTLMALAFALDGRQYGERAKNQYNSKEATKGKLQDPLRNQGQKVIGIDGRQHNTPKLSCSTSQEREFLRVKVFEDRIELSWSSNLSSLDRSQTVRANYYCAEGTCDYYDSLSGLYRNCRRYKIVGGSLGFEPADNLSACVSNPTQHDPSTLVGGLANELLSHYASIGKRAIITKTSQNADAFSYYASLEQNCQNVPSSPPQTQYMSNPYRMNDYALYYYSTCDERTDPSCKAVKKTFELEQSQRNLCYIERVVGEGKAVCPSGTKISPIGYSFEGSSIPMCGGGPRDIENFSGMAWLECVGGEYVLNVAGYWAGYSTNGSNCRSDFYPPPPQIKHKVRFGQNYSEVVGNLYVSGRKDTIDGSCIALGVRVSNQNNQLTVEIPSANQCNRFVFPQLRKVGDGFEDGCTSYEERGCRVWNEWLIDANGRRYQLVKNGQVIQAYAGCDDLVWDDQQKSFKQGECPIPQTCKTVGGKTECRHWWRKEREYKCLQDSPNLSNKLKGRVETIISTTQYQNGLLSYVECQQGQNIEYCHSPYALRGAMCVASPMCSIGGYSASTKRCEAPPTCPAGSTFNPNTLSCETSGTAHCPVGVFDPQRMRCDVGSSRLEITAYVEPHPTYLYFNPEYEAQLYEPYNGICRFTWKPNTGALYAVPCNGESYFWGNTTTIPITRNAYVWSENTQCTGYCSGGYDYCDTICSRVVRESCRVSPQGLDINVCGDVVSTAPESGVYRKHVKTTTSLTFTVVINHRNICPPGATYDPNTRKCYADVDYRCPNGFVHVGGGVCATTQGLCPAGASFDAVRKVCYVDVRCPEGGSFNAELNRCETMASLMPCSGERQSRSVYLQSEEEKCLKQCTVKRIENSKVVYDIRECENNTCPVSAGESVVSSCACNNMSGLGITAGVLQMIRNALQDWECR